jgi:hypothetical protein
MWTVLERSDPPPPAPRDRPPRQRLTRREIMRCLERYLARDLYH